MTPVTSRPTPGPTAAGPTSPLSPPAPVGFVGLGDQGSPMAAALAEAGYDLHVWARRPAALDALVAAGVPHVVHATLADLAAATDVVGLCVSTDDASDAVSDELFPALRPGAVVVDHGTGTTARAVARAARAADLGVQVLDAPVSGGRPGAEARELTVFVGGERDVLERVRPVLDAFATTVLHLGGHGAGQSAKLLNNVLLMLNQAAVADVLGLAHLMGLDPRSLQTALAHGSGSSRALTLFGSMVTTATVDHLAAVQSIDLDLFEAAVRDRGGDPSAVGARGREGVRRLGEVVTRLGA